MVEIELSIIIPARNSSGLLAGQLNALLSQQWEGTWEIVVADNGSTDDTVDVVRQFLDQDPRIRLVEASNGIGAGYARNVAMSDAHGAAFAFCDADDCVRPGWVAAIGSGLRRHDFVGGALSFESLNPAWIRTSFYSSPPSGLESFAGIFPFSATCNLGVRRSVVDRIGGFDESFLTGEDLEFCLRAWAAGFGLEYVPDAVVEYRYRQSMKGLWRRSWQYGEVGPRIARRLSEMGADRPPRFSGLKNWVWLVRRLPTLTSKSGRARWLVVAGNKAGRIVGSARARYIYL